MSAEGRHADTRPNLVTVRTLHQRLGLPMPAAGRAEATAYQAPVGAIDLAEVLDRMPLLASTPPDQLTDPEITVVIVPVLPVSRARGRAGRLVAGVLAVLLALGPSAPPKPRSLPPVAYGVGGAR